MVAALKCCKIGNETQMRSIKESFIFLSALQVARAQFKRCEPNCIGAEKIREISGSADKQVPDFIYLPRVQGGQVQFRRCDGDCC
jgi:hypothetical protein